MSTADLDRYQELARFLRTRRERLQPQQAGLPATGRRRTPGLRRSEVAMLAGVSLEWYTYLEQGRHINVSADVLEALAKALQLEAAERKHLFLLAHRQPPPEQERPQTQVSSVLQRFLDSLLLSPASVMDARMNIIAWNRAHKALYIEEHNTYNEPPNFLWLTFTSSTLRQVKGEDWEAHAARLTAQFRAEYARHADDPWWIRQVEELSAVSSDFKRIWQQHEVLENADAHKKLYHPTAGILNFDYMNVQPLDAPDLQISVHTPHPDGTVEKMQQLIDAMISKAAEV